MSSPRRPPGAAGGLLHAHHAMTTTALQAMTERLTFRIEGMQWPATLGDFALMGPINRRGAWRWYRRNVIIDGRLVAERIKVGSDLQPIWESLIRE